MATERTTLLHNVISNENNKLTYGCMVEIPNTQLFDENNT